MQFLVSLNTLRNLSVVVLAKYLTGHHIHSFVIAMIDLIPWYFTLFPYKYASVRVSGTYKGRVYYVTLVI